MQFNWEISGHENVLKSLEDDISEGNLAHAYLLTGPANVGKASTAKKMALALQCAQNNCGECSTCKEIGKGYHADTIEVIDNGESIKIEQIRLIIDKLNITKTSKYKVLIIENIERMTLVSANALLKTLEDPPERVIFLLTTNNLKEILATIISRVRLIKFTRLDDAQIKELIIAKHPFAEENVVENVCLYAQGRPGKALALMDDTVAFDSYKTLFGDVENLLTERDRTQQFLYVGDLAAAVKEEKSSNLTREFIEVFELAVRKQMLAAARGEKAVISLDKCVKLLQKTQETKRLLKNNVNLRLLLENLILNI